MTKAMVKIKMLAPQLESGQHSSAPEEDSRSVETSDAGSDSQMDFKLSSATAETAVAGQATANGAGPTVVYKF